MRLFFLVSGLFFVLSSSCYATHNRAGEITYVQLNDLTIRMTLTTYTKTSSSAADRDSVEIFWGDGTSQFITRTNGSGTELDNDVKLNTYVADHSYPGRATYTIYFEDPNRVANILNVNSPNSVEVPFFLSTTFTFLDPQFQGSNSSAVLLQPPLDFACVGKRFVHNPNAFDPDGDSLSYELIVPLQEENLDVPAYLFPDQISPGPDNLFDLNPITGTLEWNSPKLQGEYNIAFRINEWRNGQLINSIIRDMQVFVIACEDNPPVIETVDEICVIAGTFLEIPILTTDLDSFDFANLSATGGPFEVMNSASLVPITNDDPTPFTSFFRWQTTCENIRKEAYQVVFRAEDEFGLTDLKALRIKVVGPPPENIEAEAQGTDIQVQWEFPYLCGASNNFLGFSVWRRSGSNQFPMDTCITGLEGRGYTEIEFNTNQNDGSNYFFIDEDLERGVTYCYRILGEFVQFSSTGQPVNPEESLPSMEICLQLLRDVPLITKVSVDATETTNGTMDIEWVLPIAEDLDTIMNPGPYRYQLLKREVGSTIYTPVFGADFTIQNFSDPVATNFKDSGLNTTENQYEYQIAFYATDTSVLYGNSLEASSVFLIGNESDQRIDLNWNFFTPWENIEYEIYRQDPGNTTFNLLDQTLEQNYLDSNLENGLEYCYQIQSIGSYGISGLPEPILNFSQEICITPVDNLEPCEPTLEVENICMSENIQDITEEDLINILLWENLNQVCLETDDIVSIRIYYASSEMETLSLIDEVLLEEGRYEHNPANGILGCYAISAVDEAGNESILSNTICVDNCPLYELPNTFTPNGDGSNDLYIPIKNKFIDRVEFEVFNRWGNKVFETENPSLDWNGNTLSNKELADGTYYYTCRVFEQRVSGIEERPSLLKGYIHLIR